MTIHGSLCVLFFVVIFHAGSANAAVQGVFAHYMASSPLIE
jgi:hypothetical protein